jgi:hypothetical protein
MTTQTQPQKMMRLDGRKVAAAIAQIGSFTTTWLFIGAIGMDGWKCFGISLAVEVILTIAKGSILSGKSDILGGAAILIDTLLNAGGLWPYVQRIDHTPTWKMFTESVGLDGTLRQLPALGFALVIGLLLSASPHLLWRHK